MNEKKVNVSLFEEPWLKEQVNGHIFFGTIARHINFSILCLYGLVTLYIIKIILNLYPHIHYPEIIGLTVDYAIFIPLTYYIGKKFTRYKQAVLGWITLKIGLTFVGGSILIFGTTNSITKHQSDALPNFLLGILWLPILESTPKFVKYQKTISILRVILTIPVIYIGYKSGYWHWE